MSPALTFGALIVMALAQWYMNYRTLDGWNLALRRELALVTVVAALGTDDQGAIRHAFEALAAEMQAQERYEKSRWWFQRSPRVGNAWSR